MGNIDNDKMQRQGMLFDALNDVVTVGTFANNKLQGEGTVYKRDGTASKYMFRENLMEGEFEIMPKISETDADALFSSMCF